MQAWLAVKGALCSLERSRAQVKSTEEEIERTRAELERIAAVVDSSSPSFVEKKQSLVALWDRLKSRAQDELQ